MRRKIVLGRQAVPLRVNLLNSTSFVVRYERISRKNLLGNISVLRTRTIGPRNKQKTKENKVCSGKYTNTRQDQKNKKIYRKLRRAQTGKGLAGSLANLGISMGSKAINSVLGYGPSKSKNKNVKRALNSDIANYVVEETQNKAKNKLTNLFGGA